MSFRNERSVDYRVKKVLLLIVSQHFSHLAQELLVSVNIVPPAEDVQAFHTFGNLWELEG